MRIRPLTAVLLLEIPACGLAFLQMLIGLHTDEAKYLLNIGYPHPPLLRTIMAWTTQMPLHEFFWRFVFASAVVQSVWVLRDLAAVLPSGRRRALMLAWLLSSSVLLGAGSILLVHVSALFGLLLTVIAIHPKPPRSESAGGIALLWFAAVFCSLPSVLFFPVAWSAFRRMRLSISMTMFLTFAPMALLAVYGLAHPLMLARIAGHAADGIAFSLSDRMIEVFRTWLFAGGILSFVGLWGIVRSGRWSLVFTTSLVLLYIIFSPQNYYAILLTPLLCVGLFFLFCQRSSAGSFIVAHVFSNIVIVMLFLPSIEPLHARFVFNALNARTEEGTVLVDGFFGHDWQYESRRPIRKFSQTLSLEAESAAAFFVCTKVSCEEDVDGDRWQSSPDLPHGVWIRRIKTTTSTPE